MYLVFEYVDKDLKKYMDSVKGPLDPMLVKVNNDELASKLVIRSNYFFLHMPCVLL